MVLQERFSDGNFKCFFYNVLFFLEFLHSTLSAHLLKLCLKKGQNILKKRTHYNQTCSTFSLLSVVEIGRHEHSKRQIMIGIVCQLLAGG